MCFAEEKVADEQSRASAPLGRCVVTVGRCCCVTSRPCGTVSLTVRTACCSCSEAFFDFPPVGGSSCEPELVCPPHAEETRRVRRPEAAQGGHVCRTPRVSLPFLGVDCVEHPGGVTPVQPFVYIGAVTADAGSWWWICADAPLNRERGSGFSCVHAHESLFAFVLTRMCLFFERCSSACSDSGELSVFLRRGWATCV